MTSDWIEWKGGERPVPGDTVVDVCFRRGAVRTARADRWDLCWYDRNSPGDIVAYRVAGAAEPKPQADALATQVGGGHYKDLAIQPVEYIHANDIGYFEGNVIKYVTRWRAKNGVPDLEKARHYIDLLIQLERKTKGGAA